MKGLVIILAIIIGRLFIPAGLKEEFIDPTGTYILKGTVVKNRITGHSGEMRVKLLDRSKVALCFFISKGYPGYESGSFIDTLLYRDNQALYTPAADSDCTIIFCFSHKVAEIRQIYIDPQCSCGFGRDIMISTFFEKSSGDKPIIQDLSAHGISP